MDNVFKNHPYNVSLIGDCAYISNGIVKHYYIYSHGIVYDIETDYLGNVKVSEFTSMDYETDSDILDCHVYTDNNNPIVSIDSINNSNLYQYCDTVLSVTGETLNDDLCLFATKDYIFSMVKHELSNEFVRLYIFTNDIERNDIDQVALLQLLTAK